jgi:hypothetical protein
MPPKRTGGLMHIARDCHVSPVRHLILLLLLGAVSTAAAQDTAAVRTAHVTYLAGASIYIDAGRADGLVEAQEIELVRGDSVAGTLKVVFLSSRQASCEVVHGATDVVVGETVRFHPQAAPAPTPLAEAVRSAPRRTSGQGLHGRVGARYLLSHDLETGGGTSQPSIDLRLDGNRLGGTPVGIVADVRARRTAVTKADGSSAVDGRARVYQAALLWNARGTGFQGSAGRHYLQAVSSVSLLDGAVAGYSTARLSAGAFGGFEPSPADLGFTTDVLDAGAYLQWRSSAQSVSRWSVSTGAVGSYANGTTNREFAFLQFGLNSRVFSMHAIQEVDYYRPWKVDLGENPVSPTSTYLSASIRASRAISFYGAYDNRRSVRLYRDVINPATQFDDAFRQGAWGGIGLTVPHLRLGGEFRYSDGASVGQATAYTGTIGTDGLTSMRLSLSGRATFYQNPSLDGRLFTAMAGFDPAEPLHLSLSGGLRDETSTLVSSGSQQYFWYQADLDLQVARMWFWSLSGVQEEGPGGVVRQLFSSLSWRF